MCIFGSICISNFILLKLHSRNANLFIINILSIKILIFFFFKDFDLYHSQLKGTQLTGETADSCARVVWNPYFQMTP
jgi:hypothetical protein